MQKVVTFGEIMLRLATPGYQRFIQSNQLNATFGGGEANVAISLANYGIPSELVTRLPQNEIADWCLSELRKYNVGTGQIARGGDRVGIYFLETGAVARPSKVVYDRANSSIAEWKKNVQLKEILKARLGSTGPGSHPPSPKEQPTLASKQYKPPTKWE